MLALRRKMLSPAATASLTLKLVDLALVSPQETYCDIIALLSTFSREALHSENNLLNSSVSGWHIIVVKSNHNLLDFSGPVKFG